MSGSSPCPTTNGAQDKNQEYSSASPGPPIWVLKGCAQARWNREMASTTDKMSRASTSHPAARPRVGNGPAVVGKALGSTCAILSGLDPDLRTWSVKESGALGGQARAPP